MASHESHSPFRAGRRLRAGAAAAICAIGVAASGCGSTTTTSVAPSPLRCEISLSSTAGVAAGAGGPSAISVSTQAECTWSASASAPWITQLTPASGQGPAEIAFQVAANPAAIARQADIVVNDVTFRVQQNAAACVFDLDPESASAPVDGGSGSVRVTTLTGCAWIAVSSVPWIALTSGGSGTGTGTAQYVVSANTGPARQGTLTVSGQTLTIDQGEGCSYSVTPESHTVGAPGGPGNVGVQTAVGCTWDAASEASWITITSEASGSGPAVVAFTVASHDGAERTGTLRIAGQPVTVTQQSGCTFAIDPAAAPPFAAAGGTGSTTVTASNANCAWTATTGDPWITFPQGAGGTGSGVLAFAVASNASPARTGSFFVQGHEFRVQQLNGCTYAVQPLAQGATAAGGAFSAAVQTGAGCSWMATSQAPWIVLTQGAGEGPGTLGYAVQQNTGPARMGTVTLQGRTLTVSQASGCTYSIEPQSARFGFFGGEGSILVAAPDGCNWTAVSNAGWIIIESGSSGSGSGTVTYVVRPQLFGPRSGTITIANRVFTVMQN